jgi:tRNA pseudouridine55 synthase
MQLDDRVVLLDKPAGLTSFGAVRTLRRVARVQKAGHCGSLDPLATGLLVLCSGVATRAAGLFVELPKEYHARVRFGRATDSYDADGRTTAEAAVPELDPAQVRAALRCFEGEIEQRPPMVSALKVQGQRLYELARRGESVERVPRRVIVHDIVLVELGAEHADLRVRSGRGCYVRSIAHELGEALGVPAHLESLRRMAVGGFRVERAVSLDILRAALDAGDAGPDPAAAARLATAVLPIPEALGFLPALRVRRAFESALAHGVQPGPQSLRDLPRRSGKHLLLSEDGRLLLGLADVEGRAGAAGVRLALVFHAPLPAGTEETDRT